MRLDGYIICATPRSGSTLLCDLLAGTGKTGHPNSFFRQQSIPNWMRRWGIDRDVPKFEQTYLKLAIQTGTAGTGMFGLRQMWDHKETLVGMLTRINSGEQYERDQFAQAFGSLRYIFLHRDDLVAQAVSRAKAERSGLWHKFADGTDRERVSKYHEPKYDRDQISKFIGEVTKDNSRWEAWFAHNEVSPLRISYESLAESPQATLDRILDDFGLSRSKAYIKSKKLFDEVNQTWISRYRSQSD